MYIMYYSCIYRTTFNTCLEKGRKEGGVLALKADMAGERSKILIIGAAGYLGKFMVKASISLGHLTYALVRPLPPNPDPSRLQLLQEFQSMGVTIFYGDVGDHEKLVSVIRQVEIVISTLQIPQHLEQLKIISAIKEAGTIKRFIPSEFGTDVRVSVLPPFEVVLENKRKIRRAIEAAGIRHTYVSANTFAAYFLEILLHPREIHDHVTVYGSGNAKAYLNYEGDIAAYTVKAATDPRVANHVLFCRPPENIVSQLDLISSWEQKTGRQLSKTYILEEDIVKLSETLPHPDNVRMAILYSALVKGDQTKIVLNTGDLEATQLYPEYKYVSLDKLLDITLVNPTDVKLSQL